MVLRASIEFLIHPRNELRLLGAMLLSVHLAVWSDFGGPLSRSLMLAHLGLFLLWQPLWNRHRHLDLRAATIFVLAAFAFVVRLDWDVITFWMILLAGFVGGRLTTGRRERIALLLALVFIVSELLIVCLPGLAGITTIPRGIAMAFSYAMLAVPLVLLPLRGGEPRGDGSNSVDFLYGLNVSLLMAILGLGSLLNMFLTGATYLDSVLRTIIGIAVFLLALSWLWAPFAGFSGLGQMWERYLQNIGTPFEQWLDRLSRLAARRQSPAEFLRAAIEQLRELPWVSGVVWRGPATSGAVGPRGPHGFKSEAGGVEIEVFVRRPMGAALAVHGNLLLRLVGDFYVAKQREEELARNVHLQAVHETGARVTHDIKNLLQSLHTLTAAMQTGRAADRDAVQALLERQLPHLTQRMQRALEKLEAPADGLVPERSLAEWWDDLRRRHRGTGVGFRETVLTNQPIPVELFDSVVENLLENARVKKQSEPEVAIEVTLAASDDHLTLAVRDDGSAIAPDLRERLLTAPVPSRNGLGIGLYQAGRLAASLGYHLALTDARAGCVRFELSRTGPATGRGARAATATGSR